MESVNTTDLLSIITKGGIPAIILAACYGLSLLVRETKGGKVAGDERTVLLARIAEMERIGKENAERLTKVENELDAAWDLVHSMRYQRDQARLQAERLGYDPRLWPPEPATTPPNAVINPYQTQTLPPGGLPEPLPPLPQEPDGGPK